MLICLILKTPIKGGCYGNNKTQDADNLCGKSSGKHYMIQGPGNLLEECKVFHILKKMFRLLALRIQCVSGGRCNDDKKRK